jgi:hypothetical protein
MIMSYNITFGARSQYSVTTDDKVAARKIAESLRYAGHNPVMVNGTAAAYALGDLPVPGSHVDTPPVNLPNVVNRGAW